VKSYLREVGSELETIKTLGGIEGIAEKINLDLTKGLTGDDFKERSKHFGNNSPQKSQDEPAMSLIGIFVSSVTDLMTLTLLLASFLIIVLDSHVADSGHKKTAWIEASAILSMVLLFNAYWSLTKWWLDSSKNKIKDTGKTYNVLRNGMSS